MYPYLAQFSTLTRPNPKMHRYATPGYPALNDGWDAVEGVRPGKNSTYNILYTPFKTELMKTVTSWDSTDLIKKPCFS